MLAEPRLAKARILRGPWPREKAARYYVPGIVKAMAVVGVLSVPMWIGGAVWVGLRVLTWMKGN